MSNLTGTGSSSMASDKVAIKVTLYTDPTGKATPPSKVLETTARPRLSLQGTDGATHADVRLMAEDLASSAKWYFGKHTAQLTQYEQSEVQFATDGLSYLLLVPAGMNTGRMGVPGWADARYQGTVPWEGSSSRDVVSISVTLYTDPKTVLQNNFVVRGEGDRPHPQDTKATAAYVERITYNLLTQAKEHWKSEIADMTAEERSAVQFATDGLRHLVIVPKFTTMNPATDKFTKAVWAKPKYKGTLTSDFGDGFGEDEEDGRSEEQAAAHTGSGQQEDKDGDDSASMDTAASSC